MNAPTLTGKRRLVTGQYAVTLTCGCGHRMLLAFSGWTATVCDSCKAEVMRPRYSGKPGRPPRSKKAASARFELRLTGDEVRRWNALADKQGVSLSEMVREAVEMAIARGSTR